MIQINPGNSRNTSERTYDLFFVMFSKYSSTWVEYACVDVHPCVLMSCSISSEVAPLNTRPLLGFPLLSQLCRGSILLCRWPPISIISRCQCQPRVQMDSEFCRYQVCALLFCLRKESEEYSSIYALHSPTHSSVKACDFQYLCTKC